MAKSDNWTKVSEFILARLDAGVIPWRKPWRLTGSLRSADSPWRNAFTGYRYSGINTLLLAASGFNVPTFGTFNQIRKAGGSVVKGSVSIPIVFWKVTRITETGDDGKPDSKFIPLLRLYRVFNVAEQTEGLPARFYSADDSGPTEPTAEPEPERIDGAERIWSEFLAGPTAPAFEFRRSDRAFYSPGPDRIVCPERTQFRTAAGLYSTLFHEGAHSTGHPARLNRDDIGHPFGSKSYAREELTAEIAAAFLMSEAGLTFEDMDAAGIAAYVDSWRRALTDDPKCFVVAASRARKAARAMIGLPADERADTDETTTEWAA